MVGQLVQKRRLDREGVVQILLVEVLLAFFHVHTGNPEIVELRSARSPDHLKKVRHGEVHIAFGFGVEVLGSLHDHQSSGEVHSPGHRLSRDHHLNLPLQKQLLHDPPIIGDQSRVVHAYSERQSLNKTLVLHLINVVLQLIRIAHHEAFALRRPQRY